MTVTKAATKAALIAITLLLSAGGAALAQDTSMSFFVTSIGSGKGGDLGGLEGADAHCANLAEAAGVNGKTWRAYLSTQEEGKRGISARDRIGSGPWHNAKGVQIAGNLDELHLSPNIVKSTGLDENGNLVNGRGDRPNVHDLLTGTMADGTAYFPWMEGDKTCSNWTSSGEGSATVGHHDRHGGGNTSWNAAHDTRGCSMEALAMTGGAGLFMCFATNGG
ncbi:hypothetical protein K4L02_14865 [Phaeobacter inhibens]|uniref:hypothetical protein n=1 Tax=Phaeobacter inhibens TaxID=221822 RepID=UPI0021A34E01|nr:hypothetical protein [Phaeobacter inhibens]UWR64011.1 hypothetical protein K4L02_14865 [Phaeobacter inhibens]UWR99604.1 hypothetical protein K4L03_14510 [Phaeobacter inhibens]UWS03497.1 hypothetical protein K4K94_14485 [Phaeobacter inhibens]